MKYVIALGIALMTAQNVHAMAFDTITCDFTEPFITTVYKDADHTLSIITPDDIKVIQGISWKRVGDGRYVLKTSMGKVVQRMKLDYQGSDGMSDMMYPLDVVWLSAVDKSNKGLGGCSTNYFPTIDGSIQPAVQQSERDLLF